MLSQLLDVAVVEAGAELGHIVRVLCVRDFMIYFLEVCVRNLEQSYKESSP